MRKKHVFWGLLLASIAAVAAGCTAVLVGAGAAGATAYARGDLNAVASKDIDSVYEATQRALEQLELRVSSRTKDALAARIIARDCRDKKITIKLKATTEDSTKITIRVGIFGDETKSRLIYEQIQKNLKSSTAD